MVDLVKQDMTYLWASAGDIVAPDNTKIESGWAVETVPRQWWNWMQNRVDSNVAYMLQKAIPEWDATTEYIINKSYVQHLGVIYKSIQTGVNQEPGVATTYWAKAFTESTAASEALKAVTPAANVMPYFTSASAAATTPLTAFARTLLDDADATAARATLSAQALNTALTALSGVTPAANQLPYFTGGTTAAITTLTAFARTLLDDGDAATMRATLELGSIATQNASSVNITGGTITGITDLAVADGGTGASTASGARTNLGLGTVATANIQTSGYDATVGRAALNSAWGWGASGNIQELTAAGSADSLTVTALYRVASANAISVGMPVAASGVFSHYEHSATEKVQVFHAVTGAPGYYTRLYTGGAWSSWIQGWHSANQLALGTTAASGRTALGLGTAATANVTTSTTDSTIGRVLRVGDFGAGSNAVTTGDFDALSATGLYQGTDATGAPSAGVLWMVQHFASGATQAFQIASRVSADDVRYRTESGGVWSSWKILQHSGNQLSLGTTAASARTALELANSATIVADTAATPDTIALRGAGGGITATSFNGNATTASTLQTARTITLSGEVTGSTSFNGGSNVTITTAVSDSGWLTPTLVNSFTQGSPSLQYRKVGNVVYVQGSVDRTAVPPVGTTVTTLPAGYRPGKSITNMAAWIDNSDFSSYVFTPIIGSDGVLDIGFTYPLSVTAPSGAGTIAFNFAFPV